MRKVILSLLLLVALFAAAASARVTSSTCTAKCLMAQRSATTTRVTRKDVVRCLEVCAAETTTTRKNNLYKTVNQMALKLDKAAQQVLNKEVQEQEAVLSEEDMIESTAVVLSDNHAAVNHRHHRHQHHHSALSDSSIDNGATLTATTGLNIRGGPCTSFDRVGSLSSGQSTKFTGQVKTGCGYTWYSINGGWVASDFVKVSGGGSSSTPATPSNNGGAGKCTTRYYPTFKQCDAKWRDKSLGTSTICSIGCLMSSVSMALNGLGKTINGQTSNPETLNAYLKSNGGYQGNLFVWGSVSKLGLKYQGKFSNKSEIASHVCANKVVILNVKNGGHWVLATGVSGDRSTFYVNDPGANRDTFPASEVVQAAVYTA